MKMLKKHTTLFLIGAIVTLYFITRLSNILLLPIFTDEAIYVHWAQVAANDANWRFISLTDGKQPSFVWIGMILMKLIEDPLLAGRLVSVIAGFFSMVGMYFLTSELFKSPSAPFRARRLGLLASFIYVIYPFALFYDRLALYDSLVAMFIIWALFLEILLVRKPRLDTALILGMVIGGGMLTKTSANFAFILLPFSLLLFDFGQNNWKKALGKWILLALLSVGLAQVIYGALRLSPFYHIISEKNLVFVYPFSEWIRSPFGYFTGNIKGLSVWLYSYMTAPFLILAASAFLIGKYLREKLLLLVWCIAPFTALALFGKVIYPRFILFMTMPLMVLGAYALYSMLRLNRKRFIGILIPIVFLGSLVVNSYFIIADYSKANLPPADQEQFITGWPAGVGVEETVEFLREKSKNQKIYVGTQGTFGLMPYALEIYFYADPNVEIKGFWPINDNIPDEVLKKADGKPSYFVFYQPCPPCEETGIAPASWPLNEVFQIEKAEGSYYTLYEIKK